MTKLTAAERRVVRAAMRAYRAYWDWYSARHQIGVLDKDDRMWALMKACAALKRGKK